jgi:putative transposase
MSYSVKKKLWCVRQAQLGVTPITAISRFRRVPRRTLYRWIERYEEYGIAGLDNKLPGAKPVHINVSFQRLVLDEWKRLRAGARKLWIELRKQGFGVSQRQIQRILNKEGLRMNKRTRPSQIKFVKYEYPKPNMLWHTDWTDCPFTKSKLIAFIDDNSRFIVHAEYFSNATTNNTILAFKHAIERYGKPQAILTDNGTQFTPARAERGPFTTWCEEQGIKHVLGRVHHPQTNGKIERWFGTYKQEYDNRFSCLNDFVKFYNEVRLHQGIHYATPLERYKSAINAV